MTIGERIKKLRIEQGLTQEEVAFKMGYKSRSSYNKMENSNSLSLDKVEKLANIFGVSPAYLMGWQTTTEIDMGNTFGRTLELYAQSQGMSLAEISKALDTSTWELLGQDAHEALEAIMQITKRFPSSESMPSRELQLIEMYLNDYGNYTMISFATKLLSKLNYDGKRKALDQIEMLTKIEEYKKIQDDATQDLNAAHEQTDADYTDEDRQADEDLIG